MPLAGRHELPPLTMGDLSIAADVLLRGLGGAGVMTEGDFEALLRMEVTFARKKGEYYARARVLRVWDGDHARLGPDDAHRDAGDGAPAAAPVSYTHLTLPTTPYV